MPAKGVWVCIIIAALIYILDCHSFSSANHGYLPHSVFWQAHSCKDHRRQRQPDDVTYCLRKKCLVQKLGAADLAIRSLKYLTRAVARALSRCLRPSTDCSSLDILYVFVHTFALEILSAPCFSPACFLAWLLPLVSAASPSQLSSSFPTCFCRACFCSPLKSFVPPSSRLSALGTC